MRVAARGGLECRTYKIARTLLSLSPRRLVATAAAVAALIVASTGVSAVGLPPSTWVALATLPGLDRAPVFGLAVNPTNDQDVIAANGKGGIYRSVDGGTKWTTAHTGKASVLTIAYSPFNPALILAGMHGSGVLVSTNGGSAWRAATGIDGRDVRAFGFARSTIVAATDHGVYASSDGITWTPSGLTDTSIDAIAVAAVNAPVRLFAGGDAGTGAALPLFQSQDGGTTWTPMNPPISGAIVTRLAAGPLPPNSDVRPLVVGTNAGLFASADNGATFTPLSGGLLLPSTDYTQIGFTATHFARFFAASDGGGGQSGGLWSTADSGRHFSSLQPPLLSVTALAVSSDEQPVLFVATFRSIDETPMLWAYHDTGGTPQGPAPTSTPSASGARTNSSSGSILDFLKAMASSQVPYIALGVGALALIGLAIVSHFRSRRR